LLKDVRPGTGAGSSSDAAGLTPIGDGRHALFSADDGVHGREVWITDGTEDGTRLVEDVRPGAEGSAPGQFVSLGVDESAGGGGTHRLDPFG
jgi:ELWxxDGT repeat protein